MTTRTRTFTGCCGQLAASFGRYVGTDGYDPTALRDDLARFTFLLGGDDGEQLFGHNEGQQLPEADET